MGQNSTEVAYNFGQFGSTLLLNEDDFIDILKKGQAVFGISLGPVTKEIEKVVINLMPDSDVKVVDANK